MITKIFNEIITKFPHESKKNFKNNYFVNEMKTQIKTQFNNEMLLDQNFDVEIHFGVKNWFTYPIIEIFVKNIPSSIFGLKIYYLFDFNNNITLLTLSHYWDNENMEKNEVIKEWINKIIDKKYFKPSSFNDSYFKENNQLTFPNHISEMTLFLKEYSFNNIEENLLNKDLNTLISTLNELIPEYINLMKSLKSKKFIFDPTKEYSKSKENPIYNLTIYELNTLKQIGYHEFNQLYSIYIKELEEYLCNVDIVNLISVLFMIFLTTNFEDLYYFNQKIDLHDIYFIQTLALKYKSKSIKKLSKTKITRIIFLIRTIPHILFTKDQFFYITNPDKNTPETDFLFTIKFFFMDKPAYMNADQMICYNKELFKPLDNIIFNKLDITFTNLIDMFKNVIDIIVMNRIPNNKFFELSQKPKNIESIDLKYLINQDYYAFNLDEFVDLYPNKINKNSLRNVLNIISIEIGESTQTPIFKLIFDNTVIKKPLIKLDNDRYAIPNPLLLLNFQNEILYNLLIDDELKNRFNKRKSKYLENKVEKLFKQKFDDINIYKNLKFIDESGEIDVLIIIDRYILIFECKSSKIKDASKRGAIKSLRNDLKNLVKTPSKQTFKSKNKLVNNPMKFKLNNEVITLDLTNIKEILRFNVTLDSFGYALSKTENISEYIFKENNLKEKLTPTICLSDLEIILNLLENEVEIIHYFKTRQRFNNYNNFEFPELDFLTAYLTNSILLNENNNIPFDLRNSFVKTLKYYYISKDLNENGLNLSIKKPSLKLTPFWNDILINLKKEKNENWFELSIELLNYSYESQEIIFEKYNELKDELNNTNVPLKVNFMEFNDPEEISKPILIFGFEDLSPLEQKLYFSIFISDSKKLKLDEYLVIGINFKENYPYTFLKIIAKEECEFYLEIQKYLNMNIFDILDFDKLCVNL